MFHLSHSRPHPSQSAKLINYSNRLNQADRDLWNQACEAIWTDEMKIARHNARVIWTQGNKDNFAARDFFTLDGRKNIEFSRIILWQDHFIRDPANTVCGFVLFIRGFESLQSSSSERAFIWLWEPENLLCQNLGPRNVDIKHFALLLFARLTRRDLPEEKGCWRYRRSSDFAMLHRAANYKNPPTSTTDEIWPVPVWCT